MRAERQRLHDKHRGLTVPDEKQIESIKETEEDEEAQKKAEKTFSRVIVRNGISDCGLWVEGVGIVLVLASQPGQA